MFLSTKSILLVLVILRLSNAQVPPCPAGMYNTGGSCANCPSNQACLGGYYAQPETCGTGKIASSDRTNCIYDGTSVCSAGTYALVAVASFTSSISDPLCLPCPPFTICTGGLTQPRLCPAGQTPNANISATACVTTTSCSPGWYIYNGACFTCPQFFYCPGGSAPPTKCSPGLYSADSMNLAVNSYDPVFGGSKCKKESTCYSNEFPNATGCWPCEPGFTCNGGQWNPIAISGYSPPTSCSTYNYLHGNRCFGCSIVNFNCPGGTSAPQTHPPGTYKTNIDWKFFMGTQTRLPYQPDPNTQSGLRAIPISCPIGQYLNTDPYAGCSTSPLLYTCTPLGCNVCPAGHSCAGGSSAPVACANGLISNWNTTLGPIGSSCVQPDELCPEGYVSTAVFSYPGYETVRKPGYLVHPSNMNPQSTVNPPFPRCIECPSNYGSFNLICPGGHSPAIFCQSGFSTDPSSPTTKCIPSPLSCPPGFVSYTFQVQSYPGGNAQCISVAGTNRVSLGGPVPIYGTQCSNSQIPNDNHTLCITAPSSIAFCDPGQYLYRVNSIGICKPCPTGYGCPGGYVSVLDKFAVRCGQGKAPAANSSSCLWDGVTSCPPGQWGTSASRFDKPYCIACPSGAICTGGSALPVGCPYGQGPNVGSTACSVQTTCNPGYYLSNGRCSLCMAGYACVGGTSAPSLCPLRLVPVDAAGEPAVVGYSGLDSFSNPFTNAYDISIKGGFPAVSCGIPPSCPPGTYMNTTIGFEGCLPCPSGYACPGEYLVPILCTGSTIGLPPSSPTTCGLLSSVTPPSSCNIGSYLPSGGKYCEPCTLGVGCGQPCNQWSVFLNGQCTFVGSAATTCPAGKYLDASLSLAACVDCPPNSMCTGGTAYYIQCPAGQFSDSTRTKCLYPTETSCPVGSSAFWLLQSATFPTGYLWTWGGLDKVSPICTTCPSTYSCPGGYAPPRLCPDNTVPDLTSSLCRPMDHSCPIGYTRIGLDYGMNYGRNFLNFFATILGDWSNNQVSGPSANPTRCQKCDANELCPLGTTGNVPYSSYCSSGSQPNQLNTACVSKPSTCPEGQAPEYGACASCPSGYYCPGGSSSPVVCGSGKVPLSNATACVWDGTSVCAAGTYINPLTTSSDNYCVACTAGNACSGGSSAPTACVAGQIVNSGATACSSCPSGFICLGGSSPAAVCGTGKIPNSGATACVWDGTTICAAGTYINPLTTYIAGYCVACTAGNACAGGSSTPTACVAGQIVNNGATACSSCPSGFYCLGGSSPAVLCGTGKTSNSGGTACVWDGTSVCAAGTYINPLTTNTVSYCANCTAGNACAGGSSTPTACVAGQIVNSGATACSSCPSGFYCLGGSSPAAVCGTGKTPNSGGTACVWDNSTICAAGTYINPLTTNTANYCIACPSDNACAGGSDAPIACRLTGQYLDNVTSACYIPTSCNVGDFLNATGCFPCPSGSACAGGVAAAVACSAGQVVSLNTTVCVTAATSCPGSGFFLHQGICRACPAGSYCNGVTISCGPNINLVTYCVPCPADAVCGNWESYTCRTGYFYDGSSCVPTPPGPCSNGNYLNTSINGISLCAPCPYGKVCFGKGSPPTSCPPNSFPTQLVGAGYCYIRETTCSGSNVLINGRCHNPSYSPPGTACTGTPVNALVNRCTLGIAEGGAGASGLFFCAYGSNPSEWTCQISIPNIMCNNNWATNYPALTIGAQRAVCGGGAQCDFNTNIGTTQGNGITGCPCPGNATCSGSVTTCNLGYMIGSNGFSCVQLPTSCPLGQGPFNGVCTTCLSGFACPSGSLNGFAIIPSLCGSGKVPNSNTTACVWDGTTVCAAGTYLNPSTTFTSNYCLACTAGNACAGGSSTPTACVAGQIVNSGATACSSCPSGFYCLGGSSPAVLCGTGKTSNSGGTACVWDNSTICAAGTYINPLTTNTANYCIACPSNNACAGGSDAPIPCRSTGQYVNNAASACYIPTSCNAGDFINATGCFPCPSGSACAGGVAAAVACSAGQVVSLNMTICVTAETTCPSNRFLHQGICRACPIVSGIYIYCPGGSAPLNCNYNLNLGTTCATCPTYSSCTGFEATFTCWNGYALNAQRTGCIPRPYNCPVGQAPNDNGVCAACPSGYYCVGGSVSGYAPLAVMCGSGKTSNSAGTACVWDTTTICAAGTYINPSTISNENYCSTCPPLSTCAGGSSSPVSCIAGLYPDVTKTSCYLPTTCNAGDFVNATGCFPCPSGFACAGGVVAAVACSAGQVPVLNRTACITSLSTCPTNTWLYNGLCLSCPVVPGLSIYCGGGTSKFSCGGALELPMTCAPCPSNAYCNTQVNCISQTHMLDESLGNSCVPIPSGPCASSLYLNTTVNGVAVCNSCPIGRYCPGKGAAPRLCPSPRVPNGIIAAENCVAPVTSCLSYQTLVNGFCVNNYGIQSTYGCSSLPSANLTDKCAAAAVTASTSGGNSYSYLACVTSSKEWNCRVHIEQLYNCTAFQLTTISPTLKSSLCNNFDGCYTSSNSYYIFGNGVSGGPCSPSGGGGGGGCTGNPPSSGCTCVNNNWQCSGGGVGGPSVCGNLNDPLPVTSCRLGSTASFASWTCTGIWTCTGSGNTCNGAPPASTCVSPAYFTCIGNTWNCVNPGSGGSGGGPTCTGNPTTVSCTTPGNTVQCLPGATSYTCSPAASCVPPGNAPFSQTFCLAGSPSCGSNGKWACLTCSNSYFEARQLCGGAIGGSCLTECSDLPCSPHQTCPAGKYLNSPLSSSIIYTGTCTSPAAGSLSCPFGQFLVSSPFTFTLPVSATNQPPAMSFQCVPCPTGYTCPGGTGATAFFTTPVVSGSAPITCPSITSGGLSSFVGFTGSGSYTFQPLGNQFGINTITGTGTGSVYYCLVSNALSGFPANVFSVKAYVACDPNFFSVPRSQSGLNTIGSYCIPCPSGTFSPGGYVQSCSPCSGTPPAYGSCPSGQTLKCSSGSWSCQSTAATCTVPSGGPSGPTACVAGSTWSLSGTSPCNACSTCSGPNRVVSSTCTVTSDSICGCDSGSTKDALGTGCLTTSVVAMPYAISSPTLCSSTGAINAILNPSSGVALSLRGNMSVALGIPASSTFIVAVTACDSTTTLVPQNAPINIAAVPGGLTRRRLQTAALNTSSLNLVINGQTLVITLGFTIPTSVAPAMSAFLSASMSGASPATLATLATNLQTSIASSGAASSPQLSSLLSSISSTNPSTSSTAATGFSKRLNSVPVFAAAPLASSLGVSVASLGITNDTVKGVPSAIAVYSNPLAVSPTSPSTDSGSSTGGLGGLGALVLLVILPACGYYFLVYRKKKLEGEKKKGSDSEDDKKISKNSGIDSGDISFDIVSPMHAEGKGPKENKKDTSTTKTSFEPKSISSSTGPVESDGTNV
jgi:hypothetical protein